MKRTKHKHLKPVTSKTRILSFDNQQLPIIRDLILTDTVTNEQCLRFRIQNTLLVLPKSALKQAIEFLEKEEIKQNGQSK